jgi:hypothetical protein
MNLVFRKEHSDNQWLKKKQSLEQHIKGQSLLDKKKLWFLYKTSQALHFSKLIMMLPWAKKFGHALEQIMFFHQYSYWRDLSLALEKMWGHSFPLKCVHTGFHKYRNRFLCHTQYESIISFIPFFEIILSEPVTAMLFLHSFLCDDNSGDSELASLFIHNYSGMKENHDQSMRTSSSFLVCISKWRQVLGSQVCKYLQYIQLDTLMLRGAHNSIIIIVIFISVPTHN